MKQKAYIVGAGIGGMATAIRLAAAGKDVTVFEKNEYPGGKLSELRLGAYRFDKGPSLLTLPALIEELAKLSNVGKPFEYQRLDTLAHYFFEDGTMIQANASPEIFAAELSEKLGENKKNTLEFFNRSRFYYESVSDLFLTQSVSKLSNFLNFKTLKGILRSPRLGLFTSMHRQNHSHFKNKKTVQIFDRYATYNGSDPYKAPALLNQIPHLEVGLGGFIPANGMHAITTYLYEMAVHAGVTFKFCEAVEKIIVHNGRVSGLVSKGVPYESSLVVCNTDIHFAYKHLLPGVRRPEKTLAQQKSSSAVVFYWGIRRKFPNLSLHNILFSDNYEEEFRCLFNETSPHEDPTIYINITSKYVPTDAPGDGENWFVMVNVPHNSSSKDIGYKETLRANVIQKINRILKTDIESFIEEESSLDPKDIEVQTSSFGGSIYGNASNNQFSAFLRHPNYSSSVRGLYFVGGSVHPGGGIPLCLLSAKIVSEIISNDYKSNQKSESFSTPTLTV